VNLSFIHTMGYQECQTLKDEALGQAYGLEMAAVIGPAGRGKTTAWERLVTMDARLVYVRYREGLTPTGLIRSVAFAVGGVKPRSYDACFSLLMDELASARRLIVIDEMDRGSLRHINAMRDLHDICQIPVVLVGEEGLRAKINQERRIASRVRQTVNFPAVGQGDVVAFYDTALGQELPPKLAATLTRRARGDFRSVVKDALQIERRMKASGLKEITERLIKDITGEDSE